MADPSAILRALEEVAARWREPEHGNRAEAVRETLAEDNRFTEQAVAFAVNQQMSQVTAPALESWIDGRRARHPGSVGVLGAGNVPLADFQDFLAVVCGGHRFIGVPSSKSPHLLRAFVEEVKEVLPDLPAEFASYDVMLARADAVIATGTDETTAAVEQDLDEAGIPRERRLLRGHRYSVAVVDGKESADEREGIAEDALLHEGMGCRNPAIIWAPAGLSPDPYLEALAHFRSVFPAHERTPGSLKMHQAMLAAVDVPHAYADGLPFLMSKGEPEPQVPGHFRWSEYHDLAELHQWLSGNAHRLQCIVARDRVASRINPEGVPIVSPGQAQRPPLDWRPDGIDTVAFLYSLDEEK